MVPCLHPTTAGHQLDFAQYLTLARQSGFTMADCNVVEVKRWVDKEGMAGVQRRFHAAGVAWAGFGLPLNLLAEEAAFEAALAQLPSYCEIAAGLGVTRTVTWLPPSVDVDPAPLLLRVAQRTRRICDLLVSYPIRLGLEFVGPHHLRHQRYPFIHTLGDLLLLIDLVDRPNAGVLLDSYHWYTAETTAAELERLSVRKVVEVHINDTALPPNQAHDQDRLVPGEGRIDLPNFLRWLHAAGYQGPLALEILRKSPPVEPAEAVAGRAFEALSRLIGEVAAGGA